MKPSKIIYFENQQEGDNKKILSKLREINEKYEIPFEIEPASSYTKLHLHYSNIGSDGFNYPENIINRLEFLIQELQQANVPLKIPATSQ